MPPRRSKRLRYNRNSVQSTAASQLSEPVSFPSGLSNFIDTQPNMSQQYDQSATDVSWHVPKAQYKLLKAHILKNQKKSTPYKRRKTTYRKGYRRTGTYGGSSYGPVVIQGRGGYFTDALRAGYRSLQRGVPQGTFNRLGRAIGGSLGGGTGSQLGGMAGDYISKITGMGDYQIMKNDLMQLDEGEPVPTFSTLGQGMCIAHREYIQDLVIPGTPATFTLSNFRINPGLNATFPWLSAIAVNFEQYEIHGMIFEYRSTSSDFGTTTSLAMGNVILATDYNSLDANFQGKPQMENSQYSTSTKPSISVIHAIECDPSITPYPLKYVRSGSVPATADVRLYDHANFQIATNGLPTGSSGNIGELWVSYKICFYKPIFNSGSGSQSDAFFFTTGVDTNNPFGTAQTAVGGNSVGGTIASSTVYNFPANAPIGNYYLCQYIAEGSSTTLTTGFTIGATANATVKKNLTPGGGATATRALCSAVIKITAPNATFQLGTGATLPTGFTGGNFYVTLLDTDVFSGLLP